MDVPAHIQAMMPYRPGKPLEELKEEYDFDKVIKLASNENPLGASPKALAAARDALNDTFRYPDPVSRKLRRHIAQRLHIDADEMVVTAGSESLLACTIRTMMQPGEKAVAPAGAFMGFAIYLSALGGQLIQVPSPDYRFDIEALIHAVTPDVKILYLPNPNNPTGTYFTHSDLARILTTVPRTTLVMLDEAYIEYCQDRPDFPRALELRQDNMLILRTFSKAYGLAGLRVGYGIGEKGLMSQIGKVKMTFEVSLPAQEAALAALQDTDFLNRGIENNRTEMARFYPVLEKLGLQAIPSAGNFVMVACPNVAYVDVLNEALLKRGIAIRPLAAFGFPHCVRITIGQPQENDALFSALQEVVPPLCAGVPA